ncbi:hypothetical protein [Myroides odoratus]|uniref:Uncharacterized protein n=1 Tax=Myroides odoratus TaxID=256 RepID=A0A378RNF4_MYROD|nr:hypothetical protein [Myroides odoratus]QQU04032.1 hypothetical protein I6I89_01680 [Myroides odoratus]STZ28582.1 Uncharacterised protein [Myroides odoratus]
MKVLKVVINGVEVELKFSYGLLRRLSEKWGIDSISNFFEKIGSVGQVEDISFSQLNVFGDIIEAAAKNAGEETIDSDTAVEFLMGNPEVMADIMQAFMDSIPKVSEKKNKDQVK